VPATYSKAAFRRPEMRSGSQRSFWTPPTGRICGQRRMIASCPPPACSPFRTISPSKSWQRSPVLSAWFPEHALPRLGRSQLRVSTPMNAFYSFMPMPGRRFEPARRLQQFQLLTCFLSALARPFDSNVTATRGGGRRGCRPPGGSNLSLNRTSLVHPALIATSSVGSGRSYRAVNRRGFAGGSGQH